MGTRTDAEQARTRSLPDAPSHARHNSHALHAGLLVYVEQLLGPAALDEIRRLAGETRSLDKLLDFTQWCTYDETRRLLEATADVLGGMEEFRKAAAFFDRGNVSESGEDMFATFQSLGGPAGILGAIAESASKFSSVVHMEATELTASSGVVTLQVVAGFEPYALFCETTAGLLSQSSAVFGLPPALVVEERCVNRGDERCRFRVRWEKGLRDDPEARALQWQQELAGVRARFNSLRSTVAELVAGNDVDTVLERIVDRTARAVRVPRYVLAVRLDDESPVRVHAIGFDGDDVDALAAALLAEPAGTEEPSRLVADIRSARHYYGRLAAFNADGVGFFPEERANLLAYAELAAAALDSATALEEARRQSETSGALLALAHAIAEVTTVEGVASRLTAAVPSVVSAISAGVMLWDGERLATAASQGLGEGTDFMAGYSISLDDAPLLREAITRRQPHFIDVADISPDLNNALSVGGTHAVVIVPIHLGDRLYGVVSAGIAGRLEDLSRDTSMVDRLGGLAALAATAFQNAELLETVRHQSLHDALTGAPNQRLLEERVNRTLQDERRRGRQAALLFVDLDRFKNINDTLGHSVGDGILREVSDRIERAVRDVDTVARLGGDEFAVLLPTLSDPGGADAIAERILATLQLPFRVTDRDLFINASIGVALAPRDGSSYAELLRAADAAMYSAKAAGRGTHRTYRPSMTAKHLDDLGLEADLHTAVAAGQLRLALQPQVDLRTMRIVRAEALVRWHHPRRGLLGADAFIGLAEETGLVTAIDDWVLRTACQQLAEWRSDGWRDLGISVNVSERDLRDATFVARVAQILEHTGLGSGALELEITERVAEAADEEMGPVLDGLHDLGVRIAIDDFGTGNSAFSRLLRGRIDTLKIDKSFLHELSSSGDDAPFVTAMIALGHSLDMVVVAEGVETAKQAAFVRRAGCELGQGFFFSPPVDGGDFETLLLRSEY